MGKKRSQKSIREVFKPLINDVIVQEHIIIKPTTRVVRLKKAFMFD